MNFIQTFVSLGVTVFCVTLGKVGLTTREHLFSNPNKYKEVGFIVFVALLGAIVLTVLGNNTMQVWNRWCILSVSLLILSTVAVLEKKFIRMFEANVRALVSLSLSLALAKF